MVAFANGDVFVSKTDDTDVFHHYAADGTYIEDLTLQSISGFDLVRSFAQFGTHLYTVTDPQSGIGQCTIQEYDSTGAYTRTVTTGPNSGDASQNPDGSPDFALTAIQLLTFNSTGDLYETADGYFNGALFRVWQWANDGTFTQTFEVTCTGTNHAAFVAQINPTNDCELVVVTGRSAGTGYLVFRYNPCTLADITSGYVVPQQAGKGGTNFPGRFTLDGHFLMPYNTATSSARIRKYATDWSTFSDITVALPTGLTSLDHVAPTSDNDIVWAFARVAGGGATSNDYSMFRVQLSTGTVLDTAISVTSGTGYGIEDAFVWIQPSAATSRVWGIVIG